MKRHDYRKIVGMLFEEGEEILAQELVHAAGEWWEGRKFRHPKTGNKVAFRSLPVEEQRRLNSQRKKSSPQKQETPSKKKTDDFSPEYIQNFRSKYGFRNEKGAKQALDELFNVKNDNELAEVWKNSDAEWRDEGYSFQQMKRIAQQVKRMRGSGATKTKQTTKKVYFKPQDIQDFKAKYKFGDDEETINALEELRDARPEDLIKIWKDSNADWKEDGYTLFQLKKIAQDVKKMAGQKTGPKMKEYKPFSNDDISAFRSKYKFPVFEDARKAMEEIRDAETTEELQFIWENSDAEWKDEGYTMKQMQEIKQSLDPANLRKSAQERAKKKKEEEKEHNKWLKEWDKKQKEKEARETPKTPAKNISIDSFRARTKQGRAPRFDYEGKIDRVLPFIDVRRWKKFQDVFQYMKDRGLVDDKFNDDYSHPKRSIGWGTYTTKDGQKFAFLRLNGWRKNQDYSERDSIIGIFDKTGKLLEKIDTKGITEYNQLGAYLDHKYGGASKGVKKKHPYHDVAREMSMKSPEQVDKDLTEKYFKTNRNDPKSLQDFNDVLKEAKQKHLIRKIPDSWKRMIADNASNIKEPLFRYRQRRQRW